MTTFDKAFERLIGHEGKLSLDPKDRGNWTTGVIGKGLLKGTKYGISAMSYPDLDIKNLTLNQAKQIYARDYWGDSDSLPEAVRFDFFDAAVNSGYKQAARWIQKAAGAEPDGKIGPKTLLAVRMADPQMLAKRFNGHRLMAMTEMTGWSSQGRGWARRIARNLLEP